MARFGVIGDAARIWIDDRFGYEAIRMIALAPESSTLYYLAFVNRVYATRMIGLRWATRREVKHYVENC